MSLSSILFQSLSRHIYNYQYIYQNQFSHCWKCRIFELIHCTKIYPSSNQWWWRWCLVIVRNSIWLESMPEHIFFRTFLIHNFTFITQTKKKPRFRLWYFVVYSNSSEIISRSAVCTSAWIFCKIFLDTKLESHKWTFCPPECIVNEICSISS